MSYYPSLIISFFHIVISGGHFIKLLDFIPFSDSASFIIPDHFDYVGGEGKDFQTTNLRPEFQAIAFFFLF